MAASGHQATRSRACARHESPVLGRQAAVFNRVRLCGERVKGSDATVLRCQRLLTRRSRLPVTANVFTTMQRTTAEREVVLVRLRVAVVLVGFDEVAAMCSARTRSPRVAAPPAVTCTS